MTRHTFTLRVFHNAIGLAEPVLYTDDGDSVVTQTLDAWRFDAAGAQLANAPNPMTGPFFVNGAEPGDMLEIEINRMQILEDQNWGDELDVQQ
jgi:acetamidase/formamidase